MSKDSLFSKQWHIVSEDQSKWSSSELQEHERLQALLLPPLQLKPSWMMRFKLQIQMGLGAIVMASLALMVLLPRQESLTAKGALQVSLFFEHDGKVSPFKPDVILKDGDKVGVSVNSAEEAFAYWAITDDKLKALDTADDIESSRITLSPGVSKNFESSFVLVAPNQGEHLVVVVCPKGTSKEGQKPEAKKPVDSLLNHDFISQLLTEQKISSSNCIFVGYRLRSRP